MRRTAIGRRIWVIAGVTAGAAVIGAAAVAAVSPWPGPASDGAGGAIVLDGAITQVRADDSELDGDAAPSQVTEPVAVPVPQPRSMRPQTTAGDVRDEAAPGTRKPGGDGRDDREEAVPAAKKSGNSDRDDSDRDDSDRDDSDRDDSDRDDSDRDDSDRDDSDRDDDTDDDSDDDTDDDTDDELDDSSDDTD